jgi:hypothetical protein
MRPSPGVAMVVRSRNGKCETSPSTRACDRAGVPRRELVALSFRAADRSFEPGGHDDNDVALGILNGRGRADGGVAFWRALRRADRASGHGQRFCRHLDDRWWNLGRQWFGHRRFSGGGQHELSAERIIIRRHGFRYDRGGLGGQRDDGRQHVRQPNPAVADRDRRYDGLERVGYQRHERNRQHRNHWGQQLGRQHEPGRQHAGRHRQYRQHWQPWNDRRHRLNEPERRDRQHRNHWRRHALAQADFVTSR